MVPYLRVPESKPTEPNSGARFFLPWPRPYWLPLLHRYLDALHLVSIRDNAFIPSSLSNRSGNSVSMLHEQWTSITQLDLEWHEYLPILPSLLFSSSDFRTSTKRTLQYPTHSILQPPLNTATNARIILESRPSCFPSSEQSLPSPWSPSA